MSLKNTILIVDDNPVLLRGMARLLIKQGHLVQTAASGEACLARLREHVPDLLLLDVVLPDMSGLEICRKLKADPCYEGMFLVLMSSVHKSSLAQTSGLDQGADEYISRPIGNEEFVARIRAFLRIHLREKALRRACDELENQKRATESTEKKHELLIENLLEGVWMIDAGAVTTFVNRSMARMLGYAPDEMIGKHLFHFMTERQAKTAVELFDKRRVGITEVHEFTFSRKDGGELHTLIRTAPLHQEERFIGALATVTDLTEFKRIENDLQRSQAQLLQSQKMEALGALVSGVAHEINNPNSLIMFNVPLLQDIWRDVLPVIKEHHASDPNRKYGGLQVDFLERKLGQLLDQMKQAADTIASVVDTLKSFYKRSEDQQKKPVDMNEAVGNAVKLAGSTLRRARIRIHTELDPALPAMWAAPQAMEQILVNLLINAVQAITHEAGEIRIATIFDAAAREICIRIADNGKGIAPDIAPRVFDPFFTTRQRDGGSGIGLSLTYRLVTDHQGRIGFESEPEKGTTFTIAFPVMTQEHPVRILVADDDEQTRGMLRESLVAHFKAEVTEAVNGTDACIKLGRGKPDLLILDLSMPGMDGLEVCRIIQDTPDLCDLEVLIITGLPDDPRVRQIAAMGFSHIFAKPIDFKILMREIDRLLR